MTAERFTQGFLEPPLFSRQYKKAFGTLYTAQYDPVERAVTFRWPGQEWRQSLDAFQEGELRVRFEESAAV